MKDKKIKVGDIVSVNFNGAQMTLIHKGNLLSMPVATGDSWVVEDINDGVIHYISEGCTISILE
jgi:hypothetical protein